MKKRNLFSVSTLVSLLAIGLVTVSCKQQPAAQANNTYSTMSISLTDQTLHSRYSATIQGKQDVEIYPQISGLITKVCVTDGAPVKKGQTLFVIDQIAYKAAVETARANVAKAEADVATAQLTADSKRELFRENVVSEFDLQTAENSLLSAKAVLAQAKAELINARNNLSYTEIKSPVDGQAGLISLRVGALVSPSMTSPLVSVSDNDEMYVYFSMNEKQVLAQSRQNSSLIENIEAMPEVQLLLSDGSPYTQKGKIDAISGIIDPKTGAVTVRAVFPNPQQLLRSGGSGNILLPYEKNGCIVIPQTATYELQDKIFVYKVVNGKTKSTQISVFAINDGKDYIVESGLNVGDIIISEGAGLLRDNLPVSNNTLAQSTTDLK